MTNVEIYNQYRKEKEVLDMLYITCENEDIKPFILRAIQRTGRKVLEYGRLAKAEDDSVPFFEF